MTVTREQIMDALAALCFSVSDFKTTGRRLALWNKTPNQPACFVRNSPGDLYEMSGTQNVARVIEAEIWIYAKVGPDDVPGTALNNLVDAIEVALAPSFATPGRQTLGGLVQHCWLEGKSALDPGDIDGQAKAVLPVRILVP
ncbi:MAG: hypothetical protein JWL84_593 [Rhodospirillales bacterium]|nr:hypothetical protein [Rhodospirillales bacterium]